jgi:uncharacterized membrane protein
MIVGGINCSDPPNCTDGVFATYRWINSDAPVLAVENGTAQGMSASGNVIVGIYDPGDGTSVGFRKTSVVMNPIEEFDWVLGVSPDGMHVAGRVVGDEGVAAIWSAQTQDLTYIGKSDWQATGLQAINGIEPTVIGHGYLSNNEAVGFRWKAGVVTELGAIGGNGYSSPYAVSEDGSVVVGTTGSAVQSAFIWTEVEGIRTVLDELKTRGLELPADTDLPTAQFVSDDGKTIVGQSLGDGLSFWRVVLTD